MGPTYININIGGIIVMLKLALLGVIYMSCGPQLYKIIIIVWLY